MGLLSLFRALHHLSLLLLEALTDALATSHELLDAAGDAALLARDEGFGGEVVDAVVKAAVDESGEHLFCDFVSFDLGRVRA